MVRAEGSMRGRISGKGRSDEGTERRRGSSPPHPSPLPRSTGGEGTGRRFFRMTLPRPGPCRDPVVVLLDPRRQYGHDALLALQACGVAGLFVELGEQLVGI